MKAIVQDEYGSADTLRFEDIDKPAPRGGEVLVRVHAAGAHMGDWHMMTGTPYAVRLALGMTKPRTRVRGTEFAGVVEAVPPGVVGFRSGDEVYGTGKGSFAEYVLASEDKLEDKPSNLTFEQAAAVPVSGITALQGLRDIGRLKPGQKVLIVGAAGGVGSFAVQVAKALGGVVTGVCSSSKVEMVRSIGADHVIDYTKEEITASGERYDVILDIAGNRPLSLLRKALAPRGTLVLVGGEGSGDWFGFINRLLRMMLLATFSRQRLRALASKETRADLEALKKLIEEGKVTPVISETYSLSEAPEALEHLGKGHARGKVVITI